MHAETADEAKNYFGPGKVGTKDVNEQNISDGKVPVYKTSSGKIEYENIHSNTSSLGVKNANTVYQNTSSRKIIVVAYGDSNGDAYYLKGYVGLSASPSTLVAQDRWRGASITFIVPPNHYWTVTQNENGNPRIEAWEI